MKKTILLSIALVLVAAALVPAKTHLVPDRYIAEADPATEAALTSDLEITPADDFEPSGYAGGPFTPSSKDYQLKNTGPNTLYWAADKTQDWLDLDATLGQLEPNESTTVTVSLTSQADSLTEGVYTDTLTFLDIAKAVEQTRGVTLTITVPAGIWVDPNSFDVNVIEGCLLTKTLTIGNDGLEDLNFMVRTRQTGVSIESLERTGSASAVGKGEIFSIPNDHDFTVLADAPYKPGELIVRFAAKVNGREPSVADKNQILSSLGGGAIKHNFKIVPGLSLVELPEGMTMEVALQRFNKAKGILYAEPNYEVEVLSTFPNDPRFDDLWGMHNTGQTGGAADADIDAPEAWDIITGSSEIVVAVIDTGVDYTHPDLAANMWVNEVELNGTPGVDDDGNGYVDDIYGYDFCNNDGDPMDDSGWVYHGTHCSGTIGAVGDNGEGVAGVCWNVRIMAVKFLDAGGRGWYSDAVDSIEYAALMGANVMSNSWGGTSYSQALKDAIDAAGAAGALFVAAAGNDSQNTDNYPHYPSSYNSESLISVMSTDKNDNRSGFSNYGPISVDLGAPGSNILSCKGGGSYQYLNGTSMATPHVAGACALLWSMNPALSNSEVKDILLQTVDETLPGMCASEGRLNLYNAVLETRAPWIEIEPEAGTVGPADSNDISVTFDAIQMSPGSYEAEIVIISNDPYSPIKVVPVTMTVNLDDLQVTPAEGLESSGTKGGPFTPQCMTYTLTNNNSTEPVYWTTIWTEDWLEVDPNEGVLDPCESTGVNLCIDPNANLLDPNIYTDTLTFQNTDSNSIKLRPITLTVKPPDYFTEYFDEGGSDLSNLMLTFSPDGSIAYYEACRQRTTGFPTDPNGGTYVSLGDDDFVEVFLMGHGPKKKVLFYGQSYDRFYIGSNGYITFGQGDTQYSASLQNHFNLLRISALFTDLTPADNQSISFRQLGDRVAVTYQDVPLYGDKTTKNSFQIEMFYVDGTIRITWLNLAAASGVAGLSEGKGLPPVFFVQSDLGEYPPCWPYGDFDRNYSVNFSDFAVLAMYWLDVDCGIPYWCGKTDLDFSGITDTADLGIFTENWLITEDWWLQPLSHWKFDESSGDTAYDSVGMNHGTIHGAQWTTGQIGGALSFDGIDDYVEVGDKDNLDFGQSDSFSISAWIKCNETDQVDLVIIDKIEAGGAPGFHEGYCFKVYNDKLFFGIEDTSENGLYISGSTEITDNQWYHVVGVRDTSADKLYVYVDGNLDATPVTDITTGTLATSKSFQIGNQQAAYPNFFNGIIDEIAIYNRALSAEEIQKLYQEGLGNRAFNPNPANGETGVDPNCVLSWSPGKDALSHDVYLGTDYNDVNDANTTDPNVYMGNQPFDVNSYDPCGLDLETTYYWRIDENSALGTAKGGIWSFTTTATTDPNFISWWKFDEGEGDTAYDSAGNNNGTIYGAMWTTGQNNGALSFDGIDDYVEIGDKDNLDFGQSDSFSISAWIKCNETDQVDLVIVDKKEAGGAPGFHEGYCFNVYNDKLFFSIEDTSENGLYISGSTEITDNQWYHVVGVRDTSADKLYVYVDGNLDATPVTDITTGTLATSKSFQIGNQQAAYPNFFNGVIDDIRIYDRALSAQEIQQLYQEGLGEVGYWPL